MPLSLMDGARVPPQRRLLEALRQPDALRSDMKAVRRYCDSVDWASLAEESKYELREVLAGEAARRGIPAADARGALERCLPVAPEAEMACRRRQQAVQSFGHLNTEIAAIEASARREHEAVLALLSSERDRLQAEMGQVRAELEADKALLAAEREQLTEGWKAFDAEASERARLQAEITPPPADAAGYVKVVVGGDTFELLLSDIAERGGFLRAVFCDGFHVPVDEAGAYHLRFPHITRDDFVGVAQYIAGDLPAYIAPESAARLKNVAARLHMEDLMFEVGKRTVDVAAQSQAVLDKLTKASEALVATQSPRQWDISYRAASNLPHDAAGHVQCPDGWEPIGVTTYIIDNHPVVLFRRPRPA
ncbi:MAG TPA: hypothetical protein VFH51_15320 [Myxococcota bacterium]|nr:hypothetical protein [Myxococcota bacterium]